MSTHTHHPRRISAKVNTTLLAEFLNAKLGYRQMLGKAAPSTNTGIRAGVLPDGMVLGFIPNADYPSEIMVVPAPLRGTMIPTAALSMRAGAWHISPQIIKLDRLTEYEVIEIEKSAWIAAVTNLVTDFHAQRYWRDIEADVWTIVEAWPEWEAAGMSWKARAKDLAQRLDTIALSTNALLNKCKRLGLRMK